MDRESLRVIADTRPQITFCDSFNGLSPLWDYSRHCHPYIELIYRKTGHGQTDTIEGAQNFSFFDTMVYPVGCWHHDRFEPSARNFCYCMWIDAPEVKLETPLQVQDRGGKLGNLFLAIYEEYQRPNASQELLSLLVRALLMQILLFHEEEQPSIIDRIVQYLSVHMSEKITLDELSSVSFMSKSYLSKQFKEATGKTIIGYLNTLRVERAKMLLATTEKTVEEISYSVGFDSPKYFFRVFKAETGCTPACFCKREALN